MGCVFAYVIILAVIGPEKLGQKFDVAHDQDLGEAAGTAALAAVVHRGEAGVGHAGDGSSGSDQGMERGEKGEHMHAETTG